MSDSVSVSVSVLDSLPDYATINAAFAQGPWERGVREEYPSVAGRCYRSMSLEEFAIFFFPTVILGLIGAWRGARAAAQEPDDSSPVQRGVIGFVYGAFLGAVIGVVIYGGIVAWWMANFRHGG